MLNCCRSSNLELNLKCCLCLVFMKKDGNTEAYTPSIFWTLDSRGRGIRMGRCLQRKKHLLVCPSKYIIYFPGTC